MTKYFSSRIFQNFSVFISAKKYSKYFIGLTRIYLWKSKGMRGENIEHLTKTNNNFAPNCFVYHLLPVKNFNGSCLINNISIPKKVINPYIFYGLGLQLEFLNTDFT